MVVDCLLYAVYFPYSSITAPIPRSKSPRGVLAIYLSVYTCIMYSKDPKRENTALNPRSSYPKCGRQIHTYSSQAHASQSQDPKSGPHGTLERVETQVSQRHRPLIACCATLHRTTGRRFSKLSPSGSCAGRAGYLEPCFAAGASPLGCVMGGDWVMVDVRE